MDTDTNTDRKYTADQLAFKVDYDGHDAWVRDTSHTAIRQAMQRVTTWPRLRDDKLVLTAQIRYSSGVDDHEWIDDVNARGRLGDGSDDTRALVLVRANGITVDAFYADLGKRAQASTVRPARATPRIWWADKADAENA